jgi:hypothetical protein
MSLTALDHLLFEPDDVVPTSRLVEIIATEELWPGLWDPDDLATYLRGITGDTADLVVASLLVLLNRNPASLADVSWRPVAADLLTGRLDRFRPHAAKPAEKGSHAIFTACAGVVSSIEADFGAACLEFSDLRQTKTFRNAVQRRLNGRAGSVIFRPFVPRTAVDAPLADLFDAAEAMAMDPDGDTDATYAALMTAVSACEAAVDAVNTHFARATVTQVVSAVSKIATHKVELSRPPAHIRATIDSRPLPLMETGITCDVGVHLENDSSVGATQIRVRLETDQEQITIVGDPVLIDALKPRGGVPLVIPLTVLQGAAQVALEVILTWRNPDHTLGSETFAFNVPAQAANIDWGSIASLQPFAPYPVEDAIDLVGRGQILRTLELQYAAAPLGNMYITGQRRVGKTSLVRVLVQQLRELNMHLLVASVEMGEVRRVNGADTVSHLGIALSRRLIQAAGASGVIDVPAFEGSLAPINEVIDELRELDDRLTCLLIVDEFDELPDEMFRRSGPGDALFLPMRSLAQKPYVGWILVGGERMPYIRDEQATRLNTFSETKVDYLAFVEDGASASGATGNFSALVRHPLPTGLDATDEAVGQIHARTLGNPHFAKALCAELYQDAVLRKDSLIQSRDVDRAVARLAALSDVELFAHFWEDGIFSTDGSARRRIELERRHVLVAVAEGLRSGRSESGRVLAAAETSGLTRATASRTLTDFLRRGVLTDREGRIDATVPLWGAWLEDEGAYQLAPRGITERADEELRAADKAAEVSGAEISRLLKQWRAFKFRGESISRDAIGQWLEQFGPAVDQRLMLRLLERCRTINEAELLEGLRRLNRLISHEGVIALEKGQRTLTHVIVAGVGDPGASGQAMAYKYRQANNIRQRNVVAVDAIDARLKEDGLVRAVVLVDDFIGSGQTIAKTLDMVGDGGRSDVQFFAFAISGIPEALVELEQGPRAAGLGLRVEVAHPLTASQRPFQPESTVYKTHEEQTRAETVVREFGTRLVPSMPLGFGSQTALVTFPDNCPNNAPPILWSHAKGWRPLFPRTSR